MECTAANRNCTAVAAVNIERINSVNLAVFNHNIRTAALAKHTAESTGDIGIFDSKGSGRRKSLD